MAAANIDRLIRLRSSRRLGPFAWRTLMLLYGLDLPPEVAVGPGVVFPHTGRGTVVHPQTVIGSNVTIFHGVTIGREDAHVPAARSPFVGIEIGDGAVICAGAVVLGGAGVTRVGRGTIVAANAVLRRSTGEFEVWGGVPAKRIGRATDGSHWPESRGQRERMDG